MTQTTPDAPENARTQHSFCRTHPVRPATTVVAYRVPDPRSATGDETAEPVHLLVCDLPDCLDLAEDEAIYRGAPESLIDYWRLSAAELAFYAGQDAA